MKTLLYKAWANYRTAIAVSIAIVIALLSTVYLGSYIYLSRRGMQEAATFRMKGFLYIPVAEVTEQEMDRHYERARFYAPANAIDRQLTGADGPVACILFGLSK